MDKILFTAPDGALPEANSMAYKLLKILSDGNWHTRDYLCSRLGGGWRAYLQQLTGDKYSFWHILTETKEKGQASYKLDERHLSCDWEQDKDARTIARKRYKDRSYNGARNAVQRLKQAEKDKAEADMEYSQRIESKKPTQY